MEIGQRIKSRRLGSQLTLKQLSLLVGCSDAYLSQVENGKASPSIATLKKIADALKTKITDFFIESEGEEPVVLSPSQRKILTLERWNARIEALVSNSKDKRMQAFHTTIQPGGGSHGLYSHMGEEFGIVLKGELEIDLNGVIYTVKENESFYYSSVEPHSWINRSEQETVVVWVVSPPTF